MSFENTIIIDGEQLIDFRRMCEILADSNRSVTCVRVAVDEDGVKFKVNEWTWSPPFGREET